MSAFVPLLVGMLFQMRTLLLSVSATARMLPSVGNRSRIGEPVLRQIRKVPREIRLPDNHARAAIMIVSDANRATRSLRDLGGGWRNKSRKVVVDQNAVLHRAGLDVVGIDDEQHVVRICQAAARSQHVLRGSAYVLLREIDLANDDAGSLTGHEIHGGGPKHGPGCDEC